MKKCELCNSVAKMYCESDRAILCWDCDSRVHGANFLVAKHSRTLLCHLCQSPTPWNGSGPKLGQTVSVCDSCVKKNVCREDRNNEETGDEDEDEDDDEEDSSSGDDNEENQVVPWSYNRRASICSTSEERSTRIGGSVQESSSSQSKTENSLKRMREIVEPASQGYDDRVQGCSFSAQQRQNMNLSNELTSLVAFRSLKGQKMTSGSDSLGKGMAAADIRG